MNFSSHIGALIFADCKKINVEENPEVLSTRCCIVLGCVGYKLQSLKNNVMRVFHSG